MSSCLNSIGGSTNLLTQGGLYIIVVRTIVLSIAKGLGLGLSLDRTYG